MQLKIYIPLLVNGLLCLYRRLLTHTYTHIVFLIFHWVTNYPKFSDVKKKHLLFLMTFCGDLLSWAVLLLPVMINGAIVIWGLDWVRMSKMAHSHDWQVDASCHLGFQLDLLNNMP